MSVENKLFHCYNRLFPGMTQTISDVIRKASREAMQKNLTGREYQDYIEGEILDKVNP